MGKRSDYERRPRDYYPTPKKAVEPLIGHLPQKFSYCEPCAGNGALVNHLEEMFQALCFLAMDVEPQQDWIVEGDGVDLQEEDVLYCEYIITNPPYKWDVVKPLMEKWIDLCPTILLLPADFMHNKRFHPFLKQCDKIVSVGRVKWIEDSKSVGVDNYAWYFFDKYAKETKFYGRSYDR